MQTRKVWIEGAEIRKSKRVQMKRGDEEKRK
jgi:hypothetical protein